MRSRRGQVLVVAAALLLSGCSGAGGSPEPTPWTSLTRSPEPAGLGTTGRGPEPPVSGAWVGAWVKPQTASSEGRIDSVRAFEATIDRPLDVVHVFHPFDEVFPDQADLEFVRQGKVLLLSWAGNDSRLVASGRVDDVLRERARAVRDLDAPVLLRWRWEMNRPNLQAEVWSPADYVAAWKHVRRIFAEEGAVNAGWVWCPIATDFLATRGPDYYPGDSEVDWLCVDVYAGRDGLPFAAVGAEFLEWAKSRPRPIIVGEYGAEIGQLGEQGPWIEAATAVARARPQIKAMVYFDADRMEKGKLRRFSLLGGRDGAVAFRAMALDPYFDVRRTK